MRPKMLIIDMLPAADQSSRHTFETWTDISPRRVKTRPGGTSQRPVSMGVLVSGASRHFVRALTTSSEASIYALCTVRDRSRVYVRPSTLGQGTYRSRVIMSSTIRLLSRCLQAKDMAHSHPVGECTNHCNSVLRTCGGVEVANHVLERTVARLFES